VSSAAVGRVPLRQLGSEHELSVAFIGVVPVYALAAVADRPNEPAITAAKTTVSPNSLRICIVTMIQPSDLKSPHVTSCFHGYRDIQR
jgi:hypothetical protein